MRYKFVPYKISSKGTCPSCGQHNHWVYFIDTETGLRLPDNYGKCDNEIKCGFQYNPYVHPPTETTDIKIAIPIENENYHTIPYSLLNKSLSNVCTDNLSLKLISLCGNKARKTLEKYKIGCSKLYGGNSTIFWQIDINNKIRSGKIIKYDSAGKRVREPYPKISWVHKSFKEEYSLKQVLFGEWLLQDNNNKKVCIVEAEKTSLLCDMYYKNHIWLAAGQLHGISEEKLQILEGRDVVFYPDKGKANSIWKNRLEKLDLPFTYKVSDYMEKQDNFKEGSDLADIIMKQNLVVN